MFRHQSHPLDVEWISVYSQSREGRKWFWLSALCRINQPLTLPLEVTSRTSRTRPEHHSPPRLLSSPRIPSSGLIQSILWGDCSGEKDVAEANKRIITTGSKRSCKSIPSGHGGFCMKQRKSKTRQTGRCTEREGRDQRKEKGREGEEGLSPELCISWRGSSSARAAVWLMLCSDIPASLCVSHSSECWSHPLTLCAFDQTAVSRLIHNSNQSYCLLYS